MHVSNTFRSRVVPRGIRMWPQCSSKRRNKPPTLADSVVAGSGARGPRCVGFFENLKNRSQKLWHAHKNRKNRKIRIRKHNIVSTCHFSERCYGFCGFYVPATIFGSSFCDLLQITNPVALVSFCTAAFKFFRTVRRGAWRRRPSGPRLCRRRPCRCCPGR